MSAFETLDDGLAMAGPWYSQGSKELITANGQSSCNGSAPAPSQENASAMLTTAATLVSGDRDRTHGSKETNFQNIADLWNAYLGIRSDPASPLNATDIGLMMGLLKIARTQHGAHNADDFIDGCGYIACAGEISAKAASR
jgi:hypothetical protein